MSTKKKSPKAHKRVAKGIKERKAAEAEHKRFLESDEGKAKLEEQRKSFVDKTAQDVAIAITKDARNAAQVELVKPIIDGYMKAYTLDELRRAAQLEVDAGFGTPTPGSVMLERRLAVKHALRIVEKLLSQPINGDGTDEEKRKAVVEIHESAAKYALAEVMARVAVLGAFIDTDNQVVFPRLEVPPLPPRDIDPITNVDWSGGGNPEPVTNANE